MRETKNPQRRCVACRESKEKEQLLRVVRRPDGAVCIDTTGKASGRGAYVCKNAACVEKAAKMHALERSLSVPAQAAVYRDLLEAVSKA